MTAWRPCTEELLKRLSQTGFSDVFPMKDLDLRFDAGGVKQFSVSDLQDVSRCLSRFEYPGSTSTASRYEIDRLQPASSSSSKTTLRRVSLRAQSTPLPAMIAPTALFMILHLFLATTVSFRVWSSRALELELASAQLCRACLFSARVRIVAVSSRFCSRVRRLSASTTIASPRVNCRLDDRFVCAIARTSLRSMRGCRALRFV